MPVRQDSDPDIKSTGRLKHPHRTRFPNLGFSAFTRARRSSLE